MDNNVDPNLTPPAAAAAPAPSSQGVDTSTYEAELARLRQENAAYQEIYNRIQPYADDIQWLTADQQNAEFVRRSRKAYEQARRDESPVPAELRPVYDKLDRVDKFIDGLEAQQKAAAEAPIKQWRENAMRFCNDLIAKHPNELGRQSDPNMAWAGALEQFCMSRGLSAEEGWKVLGPAFVKQSSAPPPSMRADAGMPGLPPPSRQPDVAASGEGKSLGKIVLERLHAMNGAT